jgi:histidine triad (HIT) family protein
MNDCIFCKIGAGSIPSYKVYEDESVLSFLDIHPCSTGHTVIIPKKHFGEIGEVDAANWDAVMKAVKKTVEIVDKILKPAGMNVGINNRRAAGQAVPHLHWHIIPRYEKDGGGSMHSIVRSEKIEDVSEIAKKFQ